MIHSQSETCKWAENSIDCQEEIEAMIREAQNISKSKPKADDNQVVRDLLQLNWGASLTYTLPTQDDAAQGPGAVEAEPEDEEDDDDDDNEEEDDDDEEDYGKASLVPCSHEAVLKGHSQTVSSIAIDPSAARVLTGSFDCDVKSVPPILFSSAGQ